MGHDPDSCTLSTHYSAGAAARALSDNCNQAQQRPRLAPASPPKLIQCKKCPQDINIFATSEHDISAEALTALARLPALAAKLSRLGRRMKKSFVIW